MGKLGISPASAGRRVEVVLAEPPGAVVEAAVHQVTATIVANLATCPAIVKRSVLLAHSDHQTVMVVVRATTVVKRATSRGTARTVEVETLVVVRTTGSAITVERVATCPGTALMEDVEARSATSVAELITFSVTAQRAVETPAPAATTATKLATFRETARPLLRRWRNKNNISQHPIIRLMCSLVIVPAILLMCL